MPSATQRAELERDAWESWRASDFSWSGLALKTWRGWSVNRAGTIVPEAAAPKGSRSATLQDYWRDEEDFLVTVDGKQWTRVHCPMHWEDGRPAKAAWDGDRLSALQDLVAKRLSDGQPDGAVSRSIKGDTRAQLAGAVVPGLDIAGTQPVSADFTGACFVTACNFRSVVFADDADFSEASFFDEVDFSDAEFLGDSDFARIGFHGLAAFDNASFRNASFVKSRFLDRLDMSTVTADSITFFDAQFHARAEFYSITCRGELRIWRCEFHGDANFRALDISGWMSFKGSIFHHAARFSDSRFAGGADFRSSIFKGVLYFEEVTVGPDRLEIGLDMSDAEIGDRASFQQTRFEGSTRFSGTQFAKIVRLDSIAWPSSGENWHRAFSQAVFNGPLVLIGSGFGHFAAFDGATLAGGVELENVSERAAKRIFFDELRGVPAIADADAKAWSLGEKGGREEGSTTASQAEIAARRRLSNERRLRELEGGCRVLKLAMGNASNRNREHLMHRFELIARRAQRDTPRWERAASHVYGAASDYGASMLRPLVALAASLAVFSILFLGMAAALDRYVADQSLIGVSPANDAWNAVSLSWSNTFRPLAVISMRAEDPATSWAGQLLHGFPPGYGFLARALATLESLVAVVLAFLFALALRRRFQLAG